MLLIIIAIVGLSVFGLVMLPRILVTCEDKKKQARKEADNILSNPIVDSVATINQTIDKLQQITTFNVHEPIAEEDKIRINKLRDIRDSIQATST